MDSDRPEADQIVINQVGKEIEVAMRIYLQRSDEAKQVLPALPWFIAERLADCRFIRTAKEMDKAEDEYPCATS